MTNNDLTVTKPKKLGQPTKLTPSVHKIIVDLIAEGNYIITACQAAGISYDSYNHWSQWGEVESQNGGGIYFDFSFSFPLSSPASRLSM